MFTSKSTQSFVIYRYINIESYVVINITDMQYLIRLIRLTIEFVRSTPDHINLVISENGHPFFKRGFRHSGNALRGLGTLCSKISCIFCLLSGSVDSLDLKRCLCCFPRLRICFRTVLLYLSMRYCVALHQQRLQGVI